MQRETTAAPSITRREALKAMAMGMAALGLAGCGSGALAQAAGSSDSSESAQDSSISSGGTIRIGFPSSGQNFDAGTPLGLACGKGYLASYLEPLGYTVEATGFVGAAPALHEALASGDLDLVDWMGTWWT